MKRVIGLIMAMLLCVAMLSSFAASAQELPLLVPEKTTLTSTEGSFSYDGGALHVSASSDSGATVAVDIEQTVKISNTRYVHLVVEATAPFNIALKVDNGSHDVYPQLAGPSWYEQFQDTAPAMGEGVNAGSYAVVLDLANYAQYNAQSLETDGYAFIRSMHVFVKDAGEVTIKRMTLSDAAGFTYDGQPITTAAPLEAITTAPHGQADSTQPSAGEETTPTYATAPEGDYNLSRVPPVVIVLLVGGVVLVGSMVALTVMKKKKKKDE